MRVIHFVLLLLSSFLHLGLLNEAKASVRCEELDFAKSIQSLRSSFSAPGVEIPIEKSYVDYQGEVKAQRLLFYKSSDFTKALEQDQIPINSILVLDQLPLQMDVPFVSAIIVGQELLLEATHIQVLADKMGIPLIFSPNIFLSQKLRELSQQYPSFELQCSTGPCRITGSPTLFIPKAKIQSVLPKNFNRDSKKLYTIDTERYGNRAPRELSGDKFFELMNFKIAFPKRVPDITALSCGYFENFMTTFSVEGFSMKRHFYDLQRDLKRANEANDENGIRDLLNAFQQKILKAQLDRAGYDVFDEMMFELESYYYKIYKTNINTPFSIRSNQDVEDLIAAGLYKSTVAKALSKTEIEQNIRKNWVSLFDYRAYTIRRYWGQREHNLSTPLMVHPFIDNVIGHSLGTFKIDLQGRITLDINMVLGNSERATNPTAQAKVIALTLVESKNGNFEVVFKPNFQKLAIADQKQTQQFVIPALKSFLSEVTQYVRNDFTQRIYSPAAINIEFVIKKTDSIFKATELLVLQYKPSLNREVVLDLLNGLLDREDTDRKINTKNNSNHFQSLVKDLDIKPIEDIIPILYSEFAAQNKSSSPRYALVMEGRQPKLIVWSKPLYHASAKNYLNGTRWKWLKSGYVKLMTRSNSNKPILMFTETTDEDTDVDLQVNLSQQLFEQALSSALSVSPNLQKVLEVENPEIIFQTFEGQIHLPPRNNP